MKNKIINSKLQNYILQHRYIYYMVVAFGFALSTWLIEIYVLNMKETNLVSLLILIILGFPMSFYTYELADRRKQQIK